MNRRSSKRRAVALHNTPTAARDDGEPSTTMENPPLEFTSNHRDWCAIACTFVVSCGLFFVGVVLLAYEDVSTGLVLLFVSGSILTLTVCAALGKYHTSEKEEEDRPPSYRISWRRSFMRRTRQTNNPGRTEEAQQHVSDTHSPADLAPLPSCNSTHGLSPGENVLHISANSLQTRDAGALGFPLDTRQTRSLANILDPPSYEDVLQAMDETTKRKLKSELCLPSFTQF